MSRRTQTKISGNYGVKRVADAGKVCDEGYPSTVLEIAAHVTTGTLHPTQKPAELARYLVLTYSNPGDVILDPFCGSGTTLLGAKQEGRHYIGCDREAKYVEIARGRLASEFSFGPLGGGGRGESVAPAADKRHNAKLRHGGENL